MSNLAIAIPLAIIIFGLIAIGCIQTSPTGHVVGEEQQKITFAYIPSPINAIPIIALRQGFFEQEGLKVIEVKTSFIGYVFQGLTENKIDVLTGAETPAMFVALKGGKYKIIAKHEEDKDDLSIISLKQVNIKSIKDLRGKKIGFPFTSVIHYQLYKLLEENNMSASDVQMVDLTPQNMASALSHGDVDAVFIWEPVTTKIIQGLDNKVTYFSPQSKWMMNIYVSNDFNKNAEGQRKILKALVKAQRFIQENKTQAIQIVAKEVDMDEKSLEKLWHLWRFNVTKFTEINVMEDQSKWAIKAKLSNASIPNFSVMVDNTAIKEVLSEKLN